MGAMVMTILTFEFPEDAMFHGMRGKDMSEAQGDLLDIMCSGLAEPHQVLEIVAQEMGQDVDRQVALVTISMLKAGGAPVGILRHRLAEKFHGQGSLI